MNLSLTTLPEPISSELRLALLWMGLLLGGLFVLFLLLAIRRATINHAGSGSRRPGRKRQSPPIDAWTEAGRRLQIEPGSGRLDDTVDLDPFDRG